MKYIKTTMNTFLNENASEIKSLQKELTKIEDWFYNGGRGIGNRSEEEWEAKKEESVAIRRKLYALTGDGDGVSKEDSEKKRLKDTIKPKGLNKEYSNPNDVPKAVYKWILNNTSLLSTDASDAVRWSRIINTIDDSRYPRGEITIYRAVEPQYADSYIREGDWVTTDEEYAIQHNNMYFDGKGEILSMDVDGRDVLVSPTGDHEEAIYAPRAYSIDVKL